MEATEQNDFPNSGIGRPTVSRVTSDFWAMISHYKEFICKTFSSMFNHTAWYHKEIFSRSEQVYSQPRATEQGGRRKKGKEYLNPVFSRSTFCHETTSGMY